MQDLISRQAAIDALDGEITVTGRANAEAVRGYANLVCDRIKRLPSAQTEIVLCKDCKHRPTRDEDGWLDFPTERCPCQNEDDFYYSWMPDDDWFCGNAERRETTAAILAQALEKL